mmetsp:Transcript_3068/g.11790  ORF Transcript_3068/g.11790 Transcript_3068/m.11790 type:complete len:228 (-) Transcript_3068:378-1061(-)
MDLCFSMLEVSRKLNAHKSPQSHVPFNDEILHCNVRKCAPLDRRLHNLYTPNVGERAPEDMLLSLENITLVRIDDCGERRDNHNKIAILSLIMHQINDREIIGWMQLIDLNSQLSIFRCQDSHRYRSIRICHQQLISVHPHEFDQAHIESVVWINIAKYLLQVACGILELRLDNTKRAILKSNGNHIQISLLFDSHYVHAAHCGERPLQYRFEECLSGRWNCIHIGL